MRRWPDCLPTPSFPGFGLSPIDPTRRSDMEAGLARVRRVTLAEADQVEMMWVLEDAQMGAFRAWVADAPVSLAGDSDDLTSWTATGVTLSTTGDAGPDDCGPTDLTETTADSLHQVSRNLTDLVFDDTGVVIYASIAAAGRTHANIQFVTRSGAVVSTLVDLALGQIVETGAMSASIEDRGHGFWRLRLQVNTGAGAETPRLRIRVMSDAGTSIYAGDGTSGIRVCEVSVAVLAGWNLFVRSGPDGRALGADGGAAWVLVPLSTGGGFGHVEARFKGPFKATGGKGLTWTVTATMEVRYA